jgi:para-nitrobenzyl esterase
MRRSIASLSTFAAACLLAASGSAQTLVNTTSGPVQGVLEGGVLKWRAIPYAEAPGGALRYARPVPKATSPLTLDATVNGPVCLQQVGNIGGCGSGTPETVIGSEDCLSLYVWRPETPVTTPLPVMVFIHGGGGVQGCASSATTDGSDLALSQDVLVVSIQYRLGALGFFGLPALAAEDPNGSTGNYAHLDQLLALQWVRDNAAAFGGDPNNVTIFGESAGGVAVCVLIASPLSDTLFERAIIESGGCQLALPLSTTPGSPYDGATIFARSDAVATGAGCPAGPGQLACLRAATGASLVQSLASLPGSFAGLAPANTALDGYVLAEQPAALFRQGAADGRPVIVGSNKDEMTLFTIGLETTMTDPNAYEQTVRDQLGDTTADLILPLYPVVPPTSPADTYRELTEDGGWVCPTLGVADALAQGGSPAYVYHLTFAPTYGLGSFIGFLQTFHGLELFYVFGTYPNLANFPFLMALDADDAAVSDSMQAAWGSFARTGVPQTLPAWPVYAPTTPGDLTSVSALLFDSPNATSIGTAIRGGNCAALAPIGALLDPDHDNAVYDADNCPSVTNTSQADDDGDLVGQRCDTCTGTPNFVFTGSTTNRTRVSGQLDDDGDGLGNACDFDYNQIGPVITSGDFNEAKPSVGKLVSTNLCGLAPNDNRPCGIFDHDGLGPAIAVSDFNQSKSKVGSLRPPSCGAPCTPPFGSAGSPVIGKAICEGPRC